MKGIGYPHIKQNGDKFTSSCCDEEAKNQEGKPFTEGDIGSSPGFCPNPECLHKLPKGKNGKNEQLCEVWRESEEGKMLLVGSWIKIN